MNTERILDFLGGLFEECFDGSVEECDHTFSMTEEFIEDFFKEDSAAIMLWLENHGACCCDCEIAMNILGTEQGLLAQLWHKVSRDSRKAVLIEKLFDLAEADRNVIVE